MEISTNSLLATQLQTQDPKQAPKLIAEKIIQQSADIPLSITAAKTQMPKDAGGIIAELLGSAVSEAKSKSEIFEALQRSPLFKNMGNVAEDIKTLMQLIKSDSTVAKPMALLQLFSQNIEQLDGKMLQTQVQNSGIFFESKLANIVSNEGVKEAIESLKIALKSHFTEANREPSVVVKELFVALDKLSDLSSKEAQVGLKNILDLFRKSVKQEVASQDTPIFKEAYQNVQKLEYAIKQMDLIQSKVENYPKSMNVEQNFTMEVKVLLGQVKEALGSLKLENLAPKIDQLLSKDSLLKGVIEPKNEDIIKEVVKEVGKEALEEETQKIINEQTTTQLSQSQSSAKPAQSVEEALKMVANRIKQQIGLEDAKTVMQADFKEKSAVLEQKIHSLIKPELFVGKAVAQTLSLDASNAELLSDMKGVLNKLSEQLSASPRHKEALEITNRLLTQVEYHQLFSYVSSATHLYIPVSWEGLNGGSMMMKKSSDEGFHCQIELDLEQYGKLNMMLLLSNEKYIDLSIAAQKKELKEKITTHLSALKQAFNEVGLVVGGVKMLEYKEVNIVKNDYFSGESLQFGINITI